MKSGEDCGAGRSCLLERYTFGGDIRPAADRSGNLNAGTKERAAQEFDPRGTLPIKMFALAITNRGGAKRGGFVGADIPACARFEIAVPR